MEIIKQLLKSCCSVCCCCCDYSESYILINGRRYAIKELLGEGSLSFIYLVQQIGNSNTSSGFILGNSSDLYALKRIRCPFGNIESISHAMKEVDNYKRFQSPYIISLVDSQVRQEKDGSKTVCILLPFYPLGSLQDSINRNILKETFLSESECIRIMIGITRGLRCLHDPNSRDNVGDDETERDSVSMSYSDEAAFLLDDTPLELDVLSSRNTISTNSYAHRDIKPSNILFSSDGLPVISDLGLCSKSEVTLTSKLQLNELQEWVSTHCTLSYTAPELLNLKLNHTIDYKVDIWSLGCTCYAMLFGISPFEREEQLNGASLNYAIGIGKFSFPKQKRYSEGLINMIESCIQINPAVRPTTNELLATLQDLQTSSLPS